MGNIFNIKAAELYNRRFDAEYHYALKNVRLASHYPFIKLLSLAYFKTGGTPSTEVTEYWNGEIPWVSAKDFNSFRFEDSEDHITTKAIAEGTTYLVERPAMLLVTRSGILQHSLPVMITHKPTAINQDIKAFFPDDRVTVDYLGAFFDVFGHQLLPLLCKSGATVQSLNSTELMNLRIPVPPLDIQKRIVAELDAAYATKHNTDTNANELLSSIDDIVLDSLGIPPLPPPDTSLSSRIFTVSSRDVIGKRLDVYHYLPSFTELNSRMAKVETVKFGTIITNIYNGIDCRDYQETGVPYFKVANVKKYELDYTDLKYIPQNALSGVKDIKLKTGRLLLTRKGTFGNAVALKNDIEGIISSEVFCIDVNSNTINVDYLEIYLNSSIGQSFFDQHKIGAIMGSLSQEAVKAIPIVIPSKSLQEEIIAKVSYIHTKVKALKTAAGNALDATKRNIESIILGTNK